MSVISLAEHRTASDTPTQKNPASVLVLPVAPHVVARTRFSPPPPPHSHCLLVPEALDLLDRTIAKNKGAVALVAISGPGDPLATPDITLHVISKIRNRYPDLPIGLKTLGIGSEKLAGELAKAGTNLVEMEIDAMRAEVLEKLYAWIRPGQKTLKIAEAARVLLREQRHGVPALKFHEMSVTIQTTLYPGYNLQHVAQISREMLELGADGISLMLCCSEPGVEVELETPGDDTIAALQEAAGRYLPVVEPQIIPQLARIQAEAPPIPQNILPKPTGKKPNVAVASSNGIAVDLHLGHAIKFLIYGPRADGLACLLEVRDAPEPGSGKKRWEDVARVLDDCFVLLVASAGETPRLALAEKGLKILVTEENIEGTVDVLYGGGKQGKTRRM